ncbi:hypothetical protein KC19_1G141300 [Ceratodon purpureus]|uniref:Uncharacterized protein n=1 Tax=Ceratodon purpureus TaxID=3225 RepID=A0A8T0J703_CERPU|nr:hypothetical protein KC19_1G141300 [Ceratodon purpureus]
MENITANEIAGLGVGALLLAAALATPKVDAFIARGQRRKLNLCMECGGVTRIPCMRCKSRGTLNQNIFSLEGSSKPTTCPACRGKGNFPCPSCCENN